MRHLVVTVLHVILQIETESGREEWRRKVFVELSESDLHNIRRWGSHFFDHEWSVEHQDTLDKLEAL